MIAICDDSERRKHENLNSIKIYYNCFVRFLLFPLHVKEVDRCFIKETNFVRVAYKCCFYYH